MKIVIASRNAAKIREIKQICGDLPNIEWSSTSDFPRAPVVIENGRTYRENAEKKALEIARFTKCRVLADDSGIEVDALGGRPGLFSARYAREEATDMENNARLLKELKDIPEKDRTARYRAVVVLAEEGNVLCVGEGICEGRIAFAPKGAGGFGYDPLFFLPGHGKIMAEVPPELKNQISHRAQALIHIREFLKNSCAC